MKCTCETCKGEGTIDCPDCDGAGAWNASIEHVTLTKSMSNFDELVALQADAKRVILQANRLTELNPARKESYAAQLKGCLSVINIQAHQAAKRK